MAIRSNRLSQFWQELKRRKVLPILIAYVTACFAIIEFVRGASESFSLSEKTIRLLYPLSAIGIPVVIILPWIINRKKAEYSGELHEHRTEASKEKSIAMGIEKAAEYALDLEPD